MELKPGTLAHLQEYCASKIEERGFKDETLHERLVMLVEEIGELAKACRKISGMYTDSDRTIINNTGEEIAGVINMIFAVGIQLNLDIEKEFLEKNAQIDKRVYSRQQ